ncbi:hypothetical protein F2Q70_00015427 [Brassica cretica]|uniref:Uncharacterized protein n=1 Tax=Brassica cretica TaxID=69181 RepID=A0A8S9I412_BRACR|nr:hypothetical protein F2Q70_00015427 [Brassica cretica]
MLKLAGVGTHHLTSVPSLSLYSSTWLHMLAAEKQLLGYVSLGGAIYVACLYLAAELTSFLIHRLSLHLGFKPR